MAHERKSINLRDVFLDTENPRHPQQDAEPAVVEELLSKFKVPKLAEDIAKRGLSPFENLGFIKHPKIKNKYVVVEGNRRTCALKLLADPSKAPAKHRKLFEDLRGHLGSKVPKAIEGVVFDTIEESVEWKALRHEGEQDGVGMLKWSAEAKQRNAEKRGQRLYADLAIKLLDYGEKKGLIDRTTRAKLSPSTLARYLNTPAVRSTLGLAPGPEVRPTESPEQMERAVGLFLHDAVREKAKGGETPKVHSRSDSDGRNRYATELAGRLSREQAPAPRHSDEAGANERANAGRTNARRKESRRSIVAPDFRPTIPSKYRALVGVFHELKQVDESFPYASTYLLRAFVELMTKAYCERNGIGTNSKDIHVLMQAAARNLEAEVPDAEERKRVSRELKNFRTAASNPDDIMSPESLGGGLHGGRAYSRRELNTGWDNLQSAFERLILGLK